MRILCSASTWNASRSCKATDCFLACISKKVATDLLRIIQDFQNGISTSIPRADGGLSATVSAGGGRPISPMRSPAASSISTFNANGRSGSGQWTVTGGGGGIQSINAVRSNSRDLDTASQYSANVDAASTAGGGGDRSNRNSLTRGTVVNVNSLQQQQQQTIPVASRVRGASASSIFPKLLKELEGCDEPTVERIGRDIETYLGEGGGETTENLVSAIDKVALVEGADGTGPSPTELSELNRTKTRDLLVPLLLRFLTSPRAVDCDRKEFILHAEAFAALVGLAVIPAAGAVQTMTTLIRKAETRAAAMTMLGKTVEQCGFDLLENCATAWVTALRDAVQNVRDDCLQYDVGYVCDNLGWPASAAAPVNGAGVSTPTNNPTINNGSNDNNNNNNGISTASSNSIVSIHPSLPPSSASATTPVTPSNPNMQFPAVASRRVSSTLRGFLVPKTTLEGHLSSVFCLCYDNVTCNLVSNGKDGKMIVWAPDGSKVSSLSFPAHYACSSDVSSETGMLYVCGVAADNSAQKPPPSFFALERRGAGWRLRNSIEKPQLKLLSCVKTLPSSLVAVGESFRQKREAVQVYDGAASLETPIQSYVEHELLVTCLAAVPSRPDSFVSGSKDCTVKMWDVRSRRSVANFGTIDTKGKVSAHEKMVTTIEAVSENILVSGSFDSRLFVWDIRRMSGTGIHPLRIMQVDGKEVLKIAAGPTAGDGGTLAVSTVGGLFTVHLSDGVSTPASAFDTPHLSIYHDLRFNSLKNELYASGNDHNIHVFSLQ